MWWIMYEGGANFCLPNGQPQLNEKLPWSVILARLMISMFLCKYCLKHLDKESGISHKKGMHWIEYLDKVCFNQSHICWESVCLVSFFFRKYFLWTIMIIIDTQGQTSFLLSTMQLLINIELLPLKKWTSALKNGRNELKVFVVVERF